MSLHRVISCHPDLYTKPRDPRLSSQSSISLDSDIPEDGSLFESSSTSASIDTADGQNTTEELDAATSNSDKTTEQTLKTEGSQQTELVSVLSTDVQTSNNSSNEANSLHDNLAAVEDTCTSSRDLPTDDKTSIGVVNGNVNGKSYDMNFNTHNSNNNQTDNLCDSICETAKLNGINSDLNENYDVQTETDHQTG